MKAKQTNKSLDTFLSRLRPSVINATAVDKILIANLTVRCLPDETADYVDTFVSQGEEVLERYEDRDSSDVTSLKEDILDMAETMGVVTGKWMLWPSIRLVDEVWARVATSTLENRLGYAAKWSVDITDYRTFHMITVHTANFRIKGMFSGSSKN